MPVPGATGSIDLPPIPPGLGAETVAALDERPDLERWIAGVESNPAIVAPDATCGELEYRAFDADLFEEAATIPDTVLAELILDADASLGAAIAACAPGDTARAPEELEAARFSVHLVETRLIELESE